MLAFPTLRRLCLWRFQSGIPFPFGTSSASGAKVFGAFSVDGASRVDASQSALQKNSQLPPWPRMAAGMYFLEKMRSDSSFSASQPTKTSQKLTAKPSSKPNSSQPIGSRPRFCVRHVGGPHVSPQKLRQMAKLPSRAWGNL
ncbi:hypothetical protein PIB30_086128 [Stylosanthes scabra]|uniref:Uncharacterized protein n=1 Tax=Stylosanthes scabra TaxID=79078 RepID=A0ABU6WUA5_9FABA|nr:hypothetical protein [Stylosanthes scabra]